MRRVMMLLGVLAALNLAVAGVVKFVASRRHTYGDEESDTFDLVVPFSGRELESHARSFAGGSVLVMFGGAEIDLRFAQLDPMGAYMEVDCWFGGVEVIVPDNWRVILNAQTYAGGAENNASDLLARLPEDAPTLEVDARVVLGGLDIRPVSARDEPQGARESTAPA